MMLRRALKDMIDASDLAEAIENAEAAEQIEKAEAADPMEPIDSTDPTDPIESTEPRQPIDKTEPSDQSDHRACSGRPFTEDIVGRPLRARQPAPLKCRLNEYAPVPAGYEAGLGARSREERYCPTDIEAGRPRSPIPVLEPIYKPDL